MKQRSLTIHNFFIFALIVSVSLLIPKFTAAQSILNLNTATQLGEQVRTQLNSYVKSYTNFGAEIYKNISSGLTGISNNFDNVASSTSVVMKEFGKNIFAVKNIAQDTFSNIKSASVQTLGDAKQVLSDTGSGVSIVAQVTASNMIVSTETVANVVTKSTELATKKASEQITSQSASVAASLNGALEKAYGFAIDKTAGVLAPFFKTTNSLTNVSPKNSDTISTNVIASSTKNTQSIQTNSQTLGQTNQIIRNIIARLGRLENNSVKNALDNNSIIQNITQNIYNTYSEGGSVYSVPSDTSRSTALSISDAIAPLTQQITQITQNISSNTYSNIFASIVATSTATSTFVGPITSDDSITAATFYGDGSHLTGISSGLATSSVRSLFTSSATGLDYDNLTGDFSITTGYNIPLTASTTEWASKVSSQWTNAGTDIYFNTGNVGIGTDTPTYNLEVNKTGSVSLGVIGTENADIWFGRGSQSYGASLVYQTNGVVDWAAGTRGSDDGYYIYDEDDSLARFYISDDGNVGIGTTTPSSALEIGSGMLTLPAGTVSAPSLRFANDSDTGIYSGASAQIYFSRNGVAEAKIAGGLNLDASVPIRWGSNSGDIDSSGDIFLDRSAANTLRVSSNGSTGSANLIVNGNVGIGTTTPGAKLEVSGSGDLLKFSNGSNETVISQGPGFLNFVLGGNSTFQVVGNGFKIPTGAGAPQIRFRDDNSVVLSAPADGVLNLSSGIFGIGTTTPSAKFAITGSGTGTGRLFALADSNNAEKFTVLDNGIISARNTLQMNSNNIDFEGGTNYNTIGVHGGSMLFKGGDSYGMKLTANDLRFQSSHVLGWTDGSSYGGTIDTGISRLTANIIGVGTGTQGNYSGTLIAGNIGIGTSTPLYNLTIAPTSGTTAGQTLFVQDATPSTGKTKVVIKAGASQSGTNLQEWVDNNDTVQSFMRSDGYFENSLWMLAPTVQATNKIFISPFGINDSALSRSSAGTIEINNGTAGAWRDLIVRNLSMGTTSTSTTLTIQGEAGKNIFSIASSTGTNLLTMTQAGNLGIGTTIPAYKLDVQSSDNVQMWLGTSGSSYGYAIGRNISTGYLDILGNQGGFSGVHVDNLNVDGSLSVGGNSVISNWAPSLGLGTGSGVPSATLEIRGSPTTALAIGGGSGANYNFVRNSSSGVFEITGEQSGYTGFDFSTANKSHALYINDSGNIGIGTSTPNSLLTIGGTNSTGGSLVIGNIPVALGATAAVIASINTTNEALSLYGQSGQIANIFSVKDSTGAALFSVAPSGGGMSGAWSLGGGGSFSISTGATGDDLIRLGNVGGGKFFYLGSLNDGSFRIKDATASLDRLIIDTSGNVGIATSTPSARLAITGLAGTGDIFRIASSTNVSLVSINSRGTLDLNASTTGPYGMGMISLTGSRFLRGDSGNTFLGVSSGGAFAGTTGMGTQNTAIGAQTLGTVGGSAFRNVAVGNQAMYRNSSGDGNVAIGNLALSGVMTSDNNVAVGESAGLVVTSGANNTFVGLIAGGNVTTGSNNIMIGYQTYATSSSASNSLNIGNLIFGTGINGNYNTISTGNIGIGTTTPSEKLVVDGVVQSYSSTVNVGPSAYYTGSSGRKYSMLSCYDCGSAGLGGFEIYDSTAGATRSYITAGVNGWQTPSDLRLKDNIQTLSVLERIDLIRGASYTLKDSGVVQIGVIAQEIKSAFPDAVSGSEESGRFLGVSYNAIASIALQGVKELHNLVKPIITKVEIMFTWFSTSGDRFNVKGMVCVDDVCVTKDQFKQMLMNSGSVMVLPPTPQPDTSGSDDTSGSGTDVIDTGSSTPDVVPTGGETDSSGTSTGDTEPPLNSTPQEDSIPDPEPTPELTPAIDPVPSV